MKKGKNKAGIFYALISIAALATFMFSAVTLPSYKNVDHPIHEQVSIRYMKMGPEETGSPNMVTGTLADYRGFDTLIETSVIFTAGSVVYGLLSIRRKKNEIWGGDEEHVEHETKEKQ